MDDSNSDGSAMSLYNCKKNCVFQFAAWSANRASPRAGACVCLFQLGRRTFCACPDPEIKREGEEVNNKAVAPNDILLPRGFFGSTCGGGGGGSNQPQKSPPYFIINAGE